MNWDEAIAKAAEACDDAIRPGMVTARQAEFGRLIRDALSPLIEQAERDAAVVAKLQWLMDNENHFVVSKHNNGVTIYSACMGTDGKQIGDGRTFAESADAAALAAAEQAGRQA